MNEEIHYITNDGKRARNNWENDDCLSSSFMQYAQKIRSTLFSYLLVTIVRLTLFTIAFCQTRVKNLLKGPVFFKIGAQKTSQNLLKNCSGASL